MPPTWRQADALALPFQDAVFDVVCCQFGAMFFPDRVAGYAEARREDLQRASFADIAIETCEKQSRASSARAAATAYCQGTPLRNEIEARDASLLALATDRATEAIASRHGHGPVAGKIQAHAIVATG